MLKKEPHPYFYVVFSTIVFIATFAATCNSEPAEPLSINLGLYESKEGYGIYLRATKQEFLDMRSFKDYLRSLPQGSKVHLYSGCFCMETIPLGQDRISIKELKAFSAEIGITFSYACGLI